MLWPRPAATPRQTCCQFTHTTPTRRGPTGYPVAVGAVRARSAGAVDHPDRGHRGGCGVPEPVGGNRHAQRLMWTAGVVVDHPLVELGLRMRQVHERAVGAELGAQRPVETLDLPGGRGRAGLGQQMLDPVLAADPVEQHLDRRDVEPTGEHLAVVGQDLPRQPIGRATTPPVPSQTRWDDSRDHQMRADTEPGVVIDPGQRLRPDGRRPARTRRPRPSATTPSAAHAPTAATSGPAVAAPSGSIRFNRTSARYTADSRRHRLDPALASSKTNRRGPHDGCAWRICATDTSTRERHLMRTCPRPM